MTFPGNRSRFRHNTEPSCAKIAAWPWPLRLVGWLAGAGLAGEAAPTDPSADIGESGSVSVELPAMTIYGAGDYEGVRHQPFLPPVEGLQILSGKRATVVDLDGLPRVQANHYRQALATTPGLLYSEETTPLVSLGYRGLGEPHRMQFLQVLKDGLPIHADPIGYPEAYYTPPLEAVDRMEFVRGGASLLYGPQPAGALNYITARPRLDRPFSATTLQTFGSDNLYSTYNAVDGTSGRLGYLAYYNHRQADGFRTSNSDYRLDGGHFKFVLDADRDTSWTLAFDAYEEEHGEPGGLTFASGPGLANYDADREQATRWHDRFRLRRYIPSLGMIHEFDEDTALEVKAWGGYYDRFSKRQNGGGFGQFPSGAAANSNTIERQEFYSAGTETRLRHDYEIGADTQTLTAGVHFYHSDSPRTDRRGAAPDAEDGLVTSASQREVQYGALFTEHRFQRGRWSVTPGLRLETVAQDVRVERPSAIGTTLSGKGRTEFQPLVALATAYALGAGTEAYGGVAQGYRPTVFSESVVPGSGVVVGGDVEPTSSWTYEVGTRGHPTDWLTWDTSVFLVDLDNKYGGTVTTGGQTELRSVGRSLNYGWDLSAELELTGAVAALRETTEPSQAWGGRAHQVSVLASLTWMEAEIHGGSQDGMIPQYAPAYSVRGGLIYRWKDRTKVAFLGTHLTDHYATDDENPTRRIPAYMTWDLTAEVAVWRNRVTVVGGVNNVFDEDYYARIRGDGIDPAYGRNVYAGIQVSF